MWFDFFRQQTNNISVLGINPQTTIAKPYSIKLTRASFGRMSGNFIIKPKPTTISDIFLYYFFNAF